MIHDFDAVNAKSYDPGDYGLPVWKDEDHLPPQFPVAAEQEPQIAEIMSAEEAKCKLCAWAISQVGYHEGENNWQKYAENKDLQAMYGWKPQNQPWCDVFVDSAFIACFGLENACRMTYQPIGKGSALCKQSAQYYKDAGAWSNRPEVGDQVFFYASGDINHTGIVVRVVGGSIVTVEGNSSDMVAERVYSVSDSKIAGYGRPDWAAVEGKDIDVPTNDALPAETCTPELPTVRFGDVGPAVAAVQAALRLQGFDPHWIDGEAGERTERQIKEFQAAVGLAPDGVCGEETYTALFRKKFF